MTNQVDDFLHDPYVQAFPELRQFWANAAQGVFVLPYCKNCRRTHWHPRAHCPFCHEFTVEWVEASGRAQLHSYSIVHRPEEPYVLAFVELSEGPILMTNIIDCEVHPVRIGMPLQAVFRQTPQGRMALVFRPAD